VEEVSWRGGYLLMGIGFCWGVGLVSLLVVVVRYGRVVFWSGGVGGDFVLEMREGWCVLCCCGGGWGWCTFGVWFRSVL